LIIALLSLPLPNHAESHKEKEALRIESLIALVAHGDMATRLTTAHLLRSMGTTAFDYLRADLRCPSAAKKKRAAFVLGELAVPEARPLLVEAVTDENPEVRAAAVSALGKLGDPGTAPSIGPLLDDPDERVRAESIRVLGELRCTEYGNRIQSYLNDPNPLVAMQAIQAAGNLRLQSALPLLQKKYDSFPAKLKIHAIISIGAIGSPAAKPTVYKATRDEDEWVRAAAAEALGSIGNENDVPLLRTLTRDRSSYVCGSATRALGKINSVEALPCLCELLDNDTPSGYAVTEPYREIPVKEEAAAALAAIMPEIQEYPGTAPVHLRQNALKRWREWCGKQGYISDQPKEKRAANKRDVSK
jgi:HEAT repeat protein